MRVKITAQNQLRSFHFQPQMLVKYEMTITDMDILERVDAYAYFSQIKCYYTFSNIVLSTAIVGMLCDKGPLF